MVNFSKIAVSSDNSLSKWQIAFMVTIPVAVGVGYIYYCRSKNKAEPKIGASNVNNIVKNHEAVNVVKNETPVQKAENIKNKGNIAFRAGQYNEAIVFYTEAIKTCPENEHRTLATFYQNRAAAYEKLYNFEEAYDDCTKALELNNRYLKALTRRAKINEKWAKLDAALEDLAVANIIENNSNKDVIADIERIAGELGDSLSRNFIKTNPPKLPSKIFIKTYLSTFTNGSSIDKLDTSIEANEKLLQLFKKAHNALLSGQPEETEKLCTELLDKSVEEGNKLMEMEALLLRGTFYTLAKQNEKAAADLNRIIEADDVDTKVKADAYIKRATVQQHVGDAEKCFDDFKKAEELDENNPDVYHHLGQIFLMTDRTSDALSNFRKAAALKPDCHVFTVQNCFVEYKYAMSRGDEAGAKYFLNEFKNLMEKFPKSLECKTLYAQVLTEIGDYAKAESIFNAAVQNDPDNASLYVHKALLVLQWKADIQEAKNLIKTALKCDKDCEFAYETIATIEMQMCNFRAAIEYYDEAILRYSNLGDLSQLYRTRVIAEAQLKGLERLGHHVGHVADLLSNYQ